MTNPCPQCGGLLPRWFCPERCEEQCLHLGAYLKTCPCCAHAELEALVAVIPELHENLSKLEAENTRLHEKIEAMHQNTRSMKAENERLRDTIKQQTAAWADDRCTALEQQLAECYRLSGADPDGNENWRLAKDAVAEVRRLRKEFDDAEQQLAEARAVLKDYDHPWGAMPATAIQRLAAILKETP